MHKAFPLPGIEFPLAVEVPTASEEGCHCQKKRDATARKIALLSKSRRNCQSKSNDSFTNTTTTNTTSGETGKKSRRTVTLTAEDMQKKKNDVKARTTLLLSLPDEHQLQFSKYKTARELWAAILKTFGGNETTKKTKKNLLKQQYGNFKAKGSETLEQTFNRLQVIISQLQFMDVEIEQDDLNQKNEDGNTACVPTASTNVPTASASVATISQDTACAYIASQSSGSQIKFEDINQIDEDDMEYMDIKWNMALLSMRADKFWKKTWKKISIQGSDMAGFDKSKVKCFNCHKMGHFARDYMANDEEDHALVADEVAPTEFALMANTSVESKAFDNSLCSKDCKKNNDSLNSKITYLTDKLFDAKNLIYHYKLGLAQVKSRLVKYKEREVKYCEKIRTLEFKTESINECIEILKKKLETLKLEKDGVDGKLAGLLTASKDLGNLIESQRADKNKEGFGYSAVPPPPAQIYSSPKKDLSWTGLPEFADDTVTNYSRPSPTMESTSGDDQNRNPFVSETLVSPITPKPFIKFVKPKDSQSKSKIGETETPKKPPVKKRVKKSFTSKPVAHRPYRPPVRPVRTNMNDARPNRTSFNKPVHSYANRPFHRTSAVRSHYRAPWVPTVNRNFPPVDKKISTGRYVSFGQGGCKITGKGTIKIVKLKFENVYFVKDLKYNLFSVSQICDNKNSVLFTDSECIVLGRDFKLLDDANILLRTPRQHNMYSIDLNNIVPHRDLTCLVAKASAGTIWLEDFLPNVLKMTTLALLATLHMDLFGPTSVSSISHKWYCLVVTDDFSRFTWTFFLKSKDGTSGILKKFITEI
nr:hypothetical protein [Tanacetum cinerariifolium]